MFDELKDWSTKRSVFGQINILPNNDLRDHELSWRCECQPAMDAISDGWDWAWVLEHNAYDLRDEFEELDAQLEN